MAGEQKGYTYDARLVPFVSVCYPAYDSVSALARASYEEMLENAVLPKLSCLLCYALQYIGMWSMG